MKNTRYGKENITFARIRDRRGMSMAEMLVTVMIIIILAGVAFIAIMEYQRSLAQIQRDGYAKEIFIAAQNHLTMARGEGYLDLTSEENTNTDAKKEQVYGKADSTDKDVYYFLVNSGCKSDASTPAFTNTNSSLLDMMLPFGSTDETVRMGGSYLIRYQASEGKILDVFFCTPNGSPERFNYTLTDDDYGTVMGLRDDKSGRRTFRIDGKKAVLGYYGGTEADDLPTVSLNAPSIKVVNDETLYVEISGARDVGKTITDKQNANMKLIITGVESGAKKAVDLSSLVRSLEPGTSDFEKDNRLKPGKTEKTYIYALDDISKSDTHFADLGQDTKDNYFIAGEDIKVEAVVYSLSAFSNIEFSNGATENSLYESIGDPENKPATGKPKIAFVSKIRHLENLDKDVSNTCYTTVTGINSGKKMSIISASQTDDLSWKTFKTETGGNEVYAYKSTGGVGGYYPVNTEDSLIYDGLRHSIKDIYVSSDFTGNAGLFGTVKAGSKIKNLELVDFEVHSKSGGDAGALAGNANSSRLYNIIAYNTEDFVTSITEDYDKLRTASVTSGDAHAGGLIGEMTGGAMKYCGAALLVSGETSAGGLVGATGAITDHTPKIYSCYSGGHTDNAEYYEDGDKEKPLYNIRSQNGYAGGLVGYASGAEIKDSYSTCSAEGDDEEKTGGFVGFSNGTIEHCYSTGLVSGKEADNAFIGSGKAAIKTDKESYYIKSVNEYKKSKSGKVSTILYKGPGNDNVDALDTDFDDDDAVYEDFVMGRAAWNNAVPYDSVVKKYYNDRYNLMTVTQLDSAEKTRNDPKKKGIIDKDTLFVDTHYGDWPAPEVFIVNE